MGAEKCNKCPECPSFPSSCAEASSLDNQPQLSGKFSIGQSWADWADFFNPQAAGHEYYQFSDHANMCATAATCSSHITGTIWPWKIYAQATTAVPTPTPPSANCLSWCAVNTNPWSKKCAWNKNCNECDDCLAPAPPTPAPPTPAPPTVANPNCGAWCAANTNPWTQKCKWPNCACSECP